MQAWCLIGKGKSQLFGSQITAILRGEPGGIRTRDPQLRRLLLYPAELPVPGTSFDYLSPRLVWNAKLIKNSDKLK